MTTPHPTPSFIPCVSVIPLQGASVIQIAACSSQKSGRLHNSMVYSASQPNQPCNHPYANLRTYIYAALQCSPTNAPPSFVFLFAPHVSFSSAVYRTPSFPITSFIVTHHVQHRDTHNPSSNQIVRGTHKARHPVPRLRNPSPEKPLAVPVLVVHYLVRGQQHPPRPSS